MDALTRILHLSRPQAGLDMRCQLSGTYEIPHVTAPAGTAPFHLVLAGRCQIETDNGLLIAQAGDFILFPRGGAHFIQGDGEQSNPAAASMSHDGMLPMRRIGEGEVEADLLCGRFEHVLGPGDLLFKSLPDPMHVSLSNDESSASLQALVALMRYEAAKRRPGALAIVTALSQTLLAMALRRFGESPAIEANILGLLMNARLGISIQRFLKEPGRDWTIDALGKLAAMSRANYARRFRQASGMTVFEFMTRVRMAIACELLRHTRRNVGDIGREVGYQSETAFGKVFKEQVGELPSQYRRRHWQMENFVAE